ncbi:MAG: ATP-binding protein [Candidatus Altiarchaeota archaeon]
MDKKPRTTEKIRLPRPERSDIDFSDVAGLEDLKETLREEIIYPIKHPEISSLYQQTIGSGVLLYGPPGCGKTYIVKALAGEIRWPFINATCGNLIARYSGQTENNIHLLFEKCREFAKLRSHGVILFLDEIDALGFRRDEMSSGEAGYLMVVDTILSELDGISANEKVFVIGATNAPWRVDPAIKRPGRFDNCIFVAPPDAKTRKELFRLYTRNLPLSSDVDLEGFAEKTMNYSGADIKEVCNASAEIPWKLAIKTKKARRIRMEDFNIALEKTPSSLLEWYVMVREKGVDKSYENIFPNLSISVDEFFNRSKLKGQSGMKGYA